MVVGVASVAVVEVFVAVVFVVVAVVFVFVVAVVGVCRSKVVVVRSFVVHIGDILVNAFLSCGSIYIFAVRYSKRSSLIPFRRTFIFGTSCDLLRLTQLKREYVKLAYP